MGQDGGPLLVEPRPHVDGRVDVRVRHTEQPLADPGQERPEFPDPRVRMRGQVDGHGLPRLAGLGVRVREACGVCGAERHPAGADVIRMPVSCDRIDDALLAGPGGFGEQRRPGLPPRRKHEHGGILPPCGHHTTQRTAPVTGVRSVRAVPIPRCAARWIQITGMRGAESVAPP
ncbi:hypothetical protein [Streptomyces erythrochromogenes]|uniref:hypothetical protein n=1 Tax=Streptomyces erythrochromogenes TaxID=285574 RepID=UPI00030BACED